MVKDGPSPFAPFYTLTQADALDRLDDAQVTGGPLIDLAYSVSGRIAWGLRRNPTTWAALASPFAGTQPTQRGYTAHEHLDNVEFVHMNGRVQDPKLGLFISTDPLVQAPYFSQSLNRYAYVWNNPGSLVDPSGFQTESPAYTVGPCQECHGEDCLTLVSMDPSRTVLG